MADPTAGLRKLMFSTTALLLTLVLMPATANDTSSVVLQRTQPPLANSRWTETRLARGDNAIWFLATNSVERWLANKVGFERNGVWKLPAEADPLHVLHVASADASRVWLVDATTRRAWHLVDGRWEQSIQLSDEVSGVVALSSGDLLVNTPGHSSHAFAIMAANGGVRTRFGGRLTPKIAQQTVPLNTWRMAQMSDNGRIVVAHGYLPLLRTYTTAGVLIQETAVKIPSVVVLEERRQELEAVVKLDVQQCCISSKVVHFATALAVNRDAIAVRYGFDPKIEFFAADGTWMETWPVEAPATQQNWLTAGIAYIDKGLIAAELDRLVLYRRTAIPAIVGAVTTDKGGPLSGAAVNIIGHGGVHVQLSTDAKGQFELRGLSKTMPATVKVTADGYLPTERVGILGDIVKPPFAMQLMAEQCITARSAMTGEPVREYKLQIGQSNATQTARYRAEGTSIDIQDDAGRGCMRAPFRPPLLVRISASGYATREIELSDSTEITVELQPEIVVRVAAKAEDGASVAGAKLYLVPEDEISGPSFAVSSESVATSDDSGSATFRGLGAGSYLLIAEHPDYLRIEKKVAIEEGSEEVSVNMVRGGTISIRTLNASTGQPLADAEVHGEPRGAAITRALHCTTDADGGCAMSGLPNGRYTVRVTHAGYAGAHETVVLGPTERSATVVVRLSGSTAITGRVSGVENYAGSTLQVEVAKPGVPVVYAPIGPDGEFRISEAPTGSVNFWVNEPDIDSMLLHRRIEIPSNVTTYRVDLQLPSPALISGRIITASGTGCGACSVVFERQGSDYVGTTRRGASRADGSYEVRLAATGPYMVSIQDASSGSTHKELVDVVGTERRDFRIGNRTLEVRVKTMEGAAASGALVIIQNISGLPIDESMADSLGVARFTAMSSGTVRVLASESGRTASREVDLADSGSTAVTLTLSAVEGLKLNVIDAVSQIPVYRIDARVTSARGETVLRTGVIRRDSEPFVLPSLDALPLTIVLESNGYAVRTLHGVMVTDSVQTIALTPRPRTFTIEVDLAIVSPCSLEVRDALGRPMALSARAGTGPAPFTFGSALFGGLELGVYRVLLRDCRGATLEKPLQLNDGADANVRFP